MSTRKTKHLEDQPPSETRRVTRSRVQATAGPAAGTKSRKVAPKRKPSKAPAETSTKRSRLGDAEPTNGGSRSETEALRAPSEPANEAVTDKPTATNRLNRRQAPPRPNLESDSGGEERDDNPTPDLDDEVSTADPSGNEGEDADSLTAANLEEECPVPSNTPANNGSLGTNATGNVCGRGKKKVAKVLHEVPVLSNPTGGQDSDARTDSLQPAPNPTFDLHTPQPPTWSGTTDLVQKEGGRYNHTDQSQEIQAFLSAASRRANSNLVFVDGFPSLKSRSGWVSTALTTELRERRRTCPVMRAVSDRAEREGSYFSQLYSMIDGRWSSFRQNLMDNTRRLVRSEDASYGLWRDNKHPDPEGVREAAKALIRKDAYHFGKTPTGNLNPAAPYQHPEMFVALSYFFKGQGSVGIVFEGSMPTGKYGPQVPDAMVALTATCIEVAIREISTGQISSFTEKDNRQKYRSHMDTLNAVKKSKEGVSKHARLMSNIYKKTSEYALGGRATQPATEPTVVDIDNMET